MRIILAGIIGRYPWGGVTWCSLMYLLGLRALGHDVWYLEDTCECNYDPETNAIATEPGYALRHIHASLDPFGFSGRWCYVDYRGQHHGLSEAQIREVCATADLLLVLSGGCWIWRDHYRAVPRRAFIDSDPGFTQLALDGARRAAAKDPSKKWYGDFFSEYDKHFTFGGLIGTPHCPVPTGGISWKHTWQPVSLDHWTPSALALPPRAALTTVMTWQIESFTDIGGNKDAEFARVMDLAGPIRERGIEVELAVSGPRNLLGENGWRTVDAFSISSDLWRYHSYISSSRGEFSVAKHTYVANWTGWFSDRTECYLAAGRPAVVQDTGFSQLLPTGEGLFAWSNADDALAALDALQADYLRHQKSAREIAEANFGSKVVLTRLLNEATASV